MVKGFFSLEALLSMGLIVLTVTVLYFAFQLETSSVESQLSILEREQLAMRMASHLLNGCHEEGGFALCGEGGKNVLSKGAMTGFSISKMRKRFEVKPETEVGVFVKNLAGRYYLKEGKVVGNLLCVKRLALLGGEEGEEAVLGVCIG